jgi:hypothetical protein
VKHHETLTELLNAPEGEHFAFLSERDNAYCTITNCENTEILLTLYVISDIIEL